MFFSIKFAFRACLHHPKHLSLPPQFQIPEITLAFTNVIWLHDCIMTTDSADISENWAGQQQLKELHPVSKAN